MTFVKTTLALSTAFLLVSIPVAFSAESAATLSGAPAAQMENGTSNTASGVEAARATTATTAPNATAKVQNNKGPDRTGGQGGSHNGP